MKTLVLDFFPLDWIGYHEAASDIHYWLVNGFKAQEVPCLPGFTKNNAPRLTKQFLFKQAIRMIFNLRAFKRSANCCAPDCLRNLFWCFCFLCLFFVTYYICLDLLGFNSNKVCPTLLTVHSALCIWPAIWWNSCRGFLICLRNFPVYHLQLRGKLKCFSKLKTFPPAIFTN